MKHIYLSLIVAVALAMADARAAQASEHSTVRIQKTVMADGTTLAPGTYQIRIAGSAETVGTSGRAEAATSSTEGPRIEFIQNGEVKATATTVMAPKPANIPAGAHAMSVKNDNDPYVRVSIKQGGHAYLAYLPAE